MTWLRIKVKDCRDCPELRRLRVNETTATFYCNLLSKDIATRYAVRSGAPFPKIPPQCPRLLSYSDIYVDEKIQREMDSKWDDMYELEINEEEENVPSNDQRPD